MEQVTTVNLSCLFVWFPLILTCNVAYVVVRSNLKLIPASCAALVVQLQLISVPADISDPLSVIEMSARFNQKKMKNASDFLPESGEFAEQ